jgi:hypothetical protein
MILDPVIEPIVLRLKTDNACWPTMPSDIGGTSDTAATAVQHAIQDCSDFPFGENNRQPLRPACPPCQIEIKIVGLQNIAVQKQDRGQSLVLRGRADLQLHCEMCQKRLKFNRA